MTSQRGTRGAIVGMLAGLGSFRVLVALATSLSITAAVAGPMAIQARETRKELAEVATDFPDPIPTPTTPGAGPTDRVDPTTPDTPPSTEAPPTSSTSTVPGATVTTSTAPTNPRPPDEPPIITDPPPPAPGRIAISLTNDYSESYEMDGFEVFGLVFLRLDVDDASEVRFWIDDPERNGSPTRVDTSAPFELDPQGFDSSELSAGPHVLTVEVDGPNGTSTTSASFSVVK